jgi:hypothetical protein
MRNRGGFNRRTGKTTPRHKAKTHWGAGSAAKRSRSAAKGKASSPAKASK